MGRRVGPHELVVAFIVGGFFGIAGYYMTRQLEEPVGRLVDAVLGADG